MLYSEGVNISWLAKFTYSSHKKLIGYFKLTVKFS